MSTVSDPPRSNGYYLVRGFLKFSLYCYYDYFEVTGAENFPKQGPVIVAANHSNSLGDAAALMRASPRAVRLTCKDTLLEDPQYGWIVRGVDSIGVRRRVDHGGQKVDNRAAMKLVRTELRKGCCVGLFPEGLGIYHPGISPFKVGVISTAIDFVTDYHRGGSSSDVLAGLNNQNNNIDDEQQFDHIWVTPVGINFFRREMFRSACGVRFGQPIRVDADLLKSRGLDCSQLMDLSEEEFRSIRYRIAVELTEELKQSVESMIVVSQSWKIRRLCEFASELVYPGIQYVNNGHNNSCAAQYASTNLQFARALDNTNHDISEDDSNVDPTPPPPSSSSSSSSNNDNVIKLEQLWNFLYQRGIQLETTQKNLGLMSAMKDSFVGCIWLLSSLPGLIAWIPMFVFWRRDKLRTIRKGVRKHYDGLASTKQPPLMVGSPTLISMYSFVIGLCLYRYRGWSVQKSLSATALSAFGLFPLIFQFMLTGFPRFMYHFSRAYSSIKWSLFMSNEQKSQFYSMKNDCLCYLKGLVSKFNISDSNVMDSLSRRDREKLRNEKYNLPLTQVCRMFPIPFHDYAELDSSNKED